MEGWYVVFTKPRQETRAEEHLQRQGFCCFLPRIKQMRKRRGTRYKTIEPLFPRYLFVRLNLIQDDVSPIRSTQGAVGLVRFGDRLPIVPEPFINSLSATADPISHLIDISEPEFVAGQKIVIEEGPLAGVQGIFQASSGDERVLILLEMLGRQNTVAVPRQFIARVS